MRSETFKKVARMSFQSILNLIKEVKLGKVYIENEFKTYTVIKFQTQNKGEMMKKYKIAYYLVMVLEKKWLRKASTC